MKILCNSDKLLFFNQKTTLSSKSVTPLNKLDSIKLSHRVKIRIYKFVEKHSIM